MHKVHGYAYDFFYHNVFQNESFMSSLAHALFGFDIYFLVKGIHLFVWKRNDFNMRGSNLNNAKFASLGNQIKYIDNQSTINKLCHNLLQKLHPKKE